MRIPLIVNHNPKASLKGPVVFLSEGKWAFRGNFKNRNLKVITEGSPSMEMTEELVVESGSYSIEFPENCALSSVTIYAERLD